MAADPWTDIPRTSVRPPETARWTDLFGSLQAVTALADGKTLVAVGDDGTVLRGTDEGRQWEPAVASPNNRGELLFRAGARAHLRGVTALADGKTLIAVGQFGTVWRSTDEGRQWDPAVAPSTMDELCGVTALADGKTLVAVGDHGAVWRSTDEGRQWDPVHKSTAGGDYGVTMGELRGITALADGKTLIAVGQFGTVLRGTDEGRQWDPTASTTQSTLNGVTALKDGTLVAVGAGGTVLRGTDEGRKWDSVASKTTADLRGVTALADGKTLVAVGDHGTVLRSTDEGRKWDSVASKAPKDLQGVTALADGTLVAVGGPQAYDNLVYGFAEAVLRGTDEGRRWDPVAAPTTNILRGITALGDGKTLIAVGEFGTVLRGTVEGRQWDPTASPTQSTLNGVTALKDGTLVAVGDGGTVVRGTDEGRKWDPVASKTTADLRGVTALADGKALVAVGDNGTVLRSTDEGRKWDPVASKTTADLQGVTALADGTVVAVGGPQNPSDLGHGFAEAVLRGTDEGRQWDDHGPGVGGYLRGITALADGKTLVAVGDDGTVLRGTDEGRQWELVAGPTTTVSNRPDPNLRGITALADGKTLVAVGDHGMVLRGTDEGRRWDYVEHSSPRSLWSVAALADGQTLVAVGESIVREVPGSVRTAIAADGFGFTSSPAGLTLRWRYPPGPAEPRCTQVFYRLNDENSLTGLATPNLRPDGARTTYWLTWKPPGYVAAGTTIHYEIECSDDLASITWRQRLPEPQVWLPAYDSVREWLEHLSGRKMAILAVAILLVLWVLILFGLFVIAPQALVALYERMPQQRALDDAVKTLDKLSIGGALLVRWLGTSVLLFLGTSRRALDGWIAGRVPAALEVFMSRPVVRDRRIALDLPVMVNGTRRDEPWAALQGLFRQPLMALLITGPGGAGKTTLACGIGLRATGADGHPPSLADHAMLPLLIESDLLPEAAKPDGLSSYLAGLLRSALNQTEEISPSLVEALLRTGRILLIVDGLSERAPATQQAFNPTRQGFPATRLIITSRERSHPGANNVIETQTIPPGDLYNFIERYLRARVEADGGTMPDEQHLLDAAAELKRLLHDTPTTPLLASMWATEIAAGSGEVRSVAALKESYVRRLLSPAAGGDESLIDRLYIDAAAIAERELGERFQPGYVTRAAALQVLRALDSGQLERRFDLLLNSRLLETPSPHSDVVRIAPDPVAEHMVARLRTEALGAAVAAWRRLWRELRSQGMPDGFLAALNACIEDSVYGRQVPEVIRRLFRTPAAESEAVSLATLPK
jgi:photosystem II stability/assembly factor-like uncharacterized protein